MKQIQNYTGIRLISDILKDTDRKSISKIVYEFIRLFIKYRELPLHYFTHYLYKKGTNDFMAYMPNKLSSKIPSAFNDSLVKQVLDDKLYFSLFYDQKGIRLPKMTAYNNRNLFTVGSKTRVIKNTEDFRDFALELFKQNPSCDTLFIKKTYSSSGGKNIHILSLEGLRNQDISVDEVFFDLIGSAFVFQEGVIQHPELNRLNPYSLNTIRFDTFIDREGKIEVISGMLKMSTNNAAVDNLTSGGCAVGIDLNTGRLRKTGYVKMQYYGTRTLKEHPITGVKFEDFSIPFLTEAKEMVLKAAGLMPALRLIGWDVGISEKGPVLIEGNSDYGLSTNDFTNGGYMTNETFRKVLCEFQSIK